MQMPARIVRCCGTTASTHKKDSTTRQRKEKGIYVLGDSVINGMKKGLSRNHIVKVRKYPGDNTEDKIDHVKPIVRKSQM